MTNYFVRIQRDGEYQPVEIDQLTDAEMDEYIASQGEHDGWHWVKALAIWIRENVREPDPK